MRKRGLKRIAAGMLSLALSAIMAAGALPWEMAGVRAEESQKSLENPRITADSSMESGQRVTWDCVWFGSYPQAEVVPSSADYTAVRKDLLDDGDIIEDSSLYSTLQGASGWDENNEVTIDGNKYRRMKKSDATYSDDVGADGYYQWLDSDTYHYFKYEPIKWRVLKVGGEQVLLLADRALDDQEYNTEYVDATWETGTVRSWLNGYGASSNGQGIDYRSKNFIGSAFTASQRAAIADTSAVNVDDFSYDAEGINDTDDKMFLLSESEVYGESAVSHGFIANWDTPDKARRCKSSTYAKAMGTWSFPSDADRGNCSWWLRSPGFYSNYAACVYYDGRGSRFGSEVYNRGLGVCPALNLDISSDQWSYAGTVCSGEAENGGEEKEIKISSISLNKDNLTLQTGETEKLTAEISPSNASNQSLAWSSSDPSVAAVDAYGNVTAIKEGSTTITVSAQDGSGKTAACQVTVVKSGNDQTGGDKPGSSQTGGTKPDSTKPGNGEAGNQVSKVKVSKITLSGISRQIAAGKKVKLSAKVLPANADNKAIQWTSSNTKVATVNNSGVVSLKKGSGGKKVTIMAAAKDGSGVKASYTITSMKGAVKQVTISGAKSVKAGKSLKLEAKVKAAKKANKKLKWTSNNTKYAKVSSSGKVKTYKAGKGKKVKITAAATDGSGKKKTVKIKIK